MKVDIFQNQTIDAMEAYLSRLSQRQQIVASNVANIDTPGYRTLDISFYATMQELLSQGSFPLRVTLPEHKVGWNLAPPPAQAYEVQGLPFRADRNNIDLDREMMKLSQTSFGYSMMAQLLRAKFHTLASSINEGRV